MLVKTNTTIVNQIEAHFQFDRLGNKITLKVHIQRRKSVLALLDRF